MKVFLSRFKRGWLKFAELFGNVQMIVILSILYWAFLVFLAIPFKFLADPLALRNPQRAQWIHRDRPSDILESMRKQG